MNYQELNSYADQLETEGMVDLSADGAKATDVIGSICKIFQKVKPFLEVYVSLFFLPKKWKTPVITFMAFLDGLCPTE